MKDIFSIKGKVALVTGVQGYRKHDCCRFLSSERKFISVPEKLMLAMKLQKNSAKNTG